MLRGCLFNVVRISSCLIDFLYVDGISIHVAWIFLNLIVFFRDVSQNFLNVAQIYLYVAWIYLYVAWIYFIKRINIKLGQVTRRLRGWKFGTKLTKKIPVCYFMYDVLTNFATSPIHRELTTGAFQRNNWEMLQIFCAENERCNWRSSKIKFEMETNGCNRGFWKKMRKYNGDDIPSRQDNRNDADNKNFNNKNKEEEIYAIP